MEAALEQRIQRHGGVGWLFDVLRERRLCVAGNVRGALRRALCAAEACAWYPVRVIVQRSERSREEEEEVAEGFAALQPEVAAANSSDCVVGCVALADRWRTRLRAAAVVDFARCA